MEALKPKRAKWRTLKFKRRPRKLSKRSGASQPETMNDNEAEQIDRLLLSSPAAAVGKVRRAIRPKNKRLTSSSKRI